MEQNSYIESTGSAERYERFLEQRGIPIHRTCPICRRTIEVQRTADNSLQFIKHDNRFNRTTYVTCKNSEKAVITRITP